MRHHDLRAAADHIHDSIRTLDTTKVDDEYNMDVEYIILGLSEAAERIDELIVDVEGGKNEKP